MNITVESKYIDSKSDISKKTTKPYYSLKLLDEDTDTIYSCFVEKFIYDALVTCPKYAPVVLNLTLTPGKKAGSGYFRVESVEIID